MKTICSFLLIALIATPFFAQDLPKDEDGQVVYTEVVNVEGKTQDQLLQNAKRWFDQEYKSAKKRVVEGYTVLDNHNFTVKKGSKVAGGVNYDIRIMIKDGRYKYEISNLVHKDYEKVVGSGGKLERDEPKDGFSQKLWDEFKAQANEQALALIKSLKEGMVYTEEAKSSDW